MCCRVLSIFLVLFFGIGPLPASFGFSDDARLPVCCRRVGAHRCAISEEAVAQIVRASSGSTPLLSAPSRCPMYPDSPEARTSPVHALAGHFAASIVSLIAARTPAATQAVLRNGQIRTHAGRGPPSPTFL
jgi:hypothetical protein